MAPGAFLPLACTANLVKNLAAVSASTTRAPIYKTFARTNNLADVSSKVRCPCTRPLLARPRLVRVHPIASCNCQVARGRPRTASQVLAL